MYNFQADKNSVQLSRANYYQFILMDKDEYRKCVESPVHFHKYYVRIQFSNSMTLAEEMFNKYAPKGNEGIKKNIEEALDFIKDAMNSGKDYCDLYKDWTDLPDDWVVFPETLDYLRDNGFYVDELYDSGGNRYAIIKWPTVRKDEQPMELTRRQRLLLEEFKRQIELTRNKLQQLGMDDEESYNTTMSWVKNAINHVYHPKCQFIMSIFVTRDLSGLIQLWKY